MSSHRVHQSLIRPVLFGGVDPSIFILGALWVIVAYTCFGFTAPFFAAVVVLIPTLALLAYLTRDDHLAIYLWVRTLFHQDYYPAHSRLADGRIPPPRKSLPFAS